MQSVIENKSLNEIRFAVVDTETTGLSGTNDFVLQLGVVISRSDGTIEEQYETFVRRFFGNLVGSALIRCTASNALTCAVASALKKWSPR